MEMLLADHIIGSWEYAFLDNEVLTNDNCSVRIIYVIREPGIR
jgi:hypothetical protein